MVEAINHMTLLPLREKVARAAGRMRGRAGLSAFFRTTLSPKGPRDPSSVSFADTFSRKGRREGIT
jgi:hypothetical protein